MVNLKIVFLGETEEHDKISMLQLLSRFPITLNVFLISNAGIMNGFNATTLDLHLTEV